jgi:hypothetical protein
VIVSDPCASARRDELTRVIADRPCADIAPDEAVIHFAGVTAPFLSCAVPTELFGKLIAA